MHDWVNEVEHQLASRYQIRKNNRNGGDLTLHIPHAQFL